MGINPRNLPGGQALKWTVKPSAELELERLTTQTPGKSPDLADDAVQLAAAEGRMRLGMGRAATFLTGLGRSALSSTSSSGTASSGSTGRNIFDRSAMSGTAMRSAVVGARTSNRREVVGGP